MAGPERETRFRPKPANGVSGGNESLSEEKPRIIQHTRLTKKLRDGGGAYYDADTDEIHMVDPWVWNEFVVAHETEHWKQARQGVLGPLFKLRVRVWLALGQVVPAFSVIAYGAAYGFNTDLLWLLAGWMGLMALVSYYSLVHPEKLADKVALEVIGGYADE